MIQLTDKETGAALGTINEDELQFLIGHLEEESNEDQDYYLTEVTVDDFEANGADAALITLLRSALEDRTEMEISWSRE